MCSGSEFDDIFRVFAGETANAPLLLDKMKSVRQNSRGYFPFLIAVTDSYLVGEKLANIFGSHRGNAGLAVVTTHGVEEILSSEEEALAGFILYYMARYTMSFIAPNVKIHEETRSCIYDKKMFKRDIIKSMKFGAICQNCRNAIWESGKGTSSQIDAINTILEHASNLVHKTDLTNKPKVFIGSSSHHSTLAHSFKNLMGDKLQVHVWDEDDVFKLGYATLEQLIKHIEYYDFSIFFMLPDDEIKKVGGNIFIPRDNVIFGAGLFIGKTSRSHAIMISALKDQVHLPSDLLGVTVLQIDYTRPMEGLNMVAERATSHIMRIYERGFSPQEREVDDDNITTALSRNTKPVVR